MSASPFLARQARSRLPRAGLPKAGLPRALTVLVPLVAAALVGGVLLRSPTLPSCDAPGVLERLASALDEIPALAGRNARLLELDEARARGYSGRHSLRACQGRLVTSAGSGAIEFSIRRVRGGALAVRPELFQGGWRDELHPTGG